MLKYEVFFDDVNGGEFLPEFSVTMEVKDEDSLPSVVVYEGKIFLLYSNTYEGDESLEVNYRETAYCLIPSTQVAGKHQKYKGVPSNATVN